MNIMKPQDLAEPVGHLLARLTYTCVFLGNTEICMLVEYLELML